MSKNLYETIGKFTPDKLIAGPELAILTTGVTLKAGQGILKRGTVIGLETSTKKGVIVDNSKNDGTEKAFAILTDDVDTTEEVTTTAYTTGVFNKNALIFGGDDKPEDHEARLRELGIFLRNVI